MDNIYNHVPEIIDDYEHPDSALEYVLENVLSEITINDEHFRALQTSYNTIILNQCFCSTADNCSSCIHSGNYVMHPTYSELVLREDRNGKRVVLDLLYECSALCGCDIRKCTNRLVQFGPRQNLQIIDSKLYLSKGLVTTADIPKGAFICEYAGELLTKAEALRRNAENTRYKKANYILWLNECETGGNCAPQLTIVDPSRRGNIGRFLNHSCDPNCVLYSVRVDCLVPKIAIFSNRLILAGEELCFHYAGGRESRHVTENNKDIHSNTLCLCNSAKCEKYLPNFECF